MTWRPSLKAITIHCPATSGVLYQQGMLYAPALNQQPSTLNTQHSTLNTQHSTLNTQMMLALLQELLMGGT
ncbi:hypothetical protein [Synechococcus sp. Cu2B8-bc1011]|uniref:hypothetical protein n=1 Tax=Synechococcus sp. Cu2B8-bc1011 TaxID=3093725 RepID=UPI0039AFCCD0